MFAFEPPEEVVSSIQEIKEFQQHILEIERVYEEIKKEVEQSVTVNVTKQLDKLQNDTEKVLTEYLKWWEEKTSTGHVPQDQANLFQTEEKRAKTLLSNIVELKAPKTLQSTVQTQQSMVRTQQSTMQTQQSTVQTQQSTVQAQQSEWLEGWQILNNLKDKFDKTLLCKLTSRSLFSQRNDV